MDRSFKRTISGYEVKFQQIEQSLQIQLKPITKDKILFARYTHDNIPAGYLGPADSFYDFYNMIAGLISNISLHLHNDKQLVILGEQRAFRLPLQATEVSSQEQMQYHKYKKILWQYQKLRIEHSKVKRRNEQLEQILHAKYDQIKQLRQQMNQIKLEPRKDTRKKKKKNIPKQKETTVKKKTEYKEEQEDLVKKYKAQRPASSKDKGTQYKLYLHVCDLCKSNCEIEKTPYRRNGYVICHGCKRRYQLESYKDNLLDNQAFNDIVKYIQEEEQ